MQTIEPLVRECAHCVKELGLQPNPKASHVVCFRHALTLCQVPGEVLDQDTKAFQHEMLERSYTRPEDFCPDLKAENNSQIPVDT